MYYIGSLHYLNNPYNSCILNAETGTERLGYLLCATQQVNLRARIGAQ